MSSSYQIYLYSTSTWLAFQSLVLFISPKFVVMMVTTDGRVAADIETYTLRSISISYLTLSLLSFLFASSLSPIPTPDPPSSPTSSTPPTSPSQLSLLTTLTLFQILSALHAYTQTSSSNSFILGTVIAGNGILSCMGTWNLLFGFGEGRKSKRTGLDKRVSNWPLGERKRRGNKSL